MNSLPLVVGAVIVDRYPYPARVLAARRTRPPELAGQWEFAGGKVEPGEGPEEALVREISEELSVEVHVIEELLNPMGELWPASNGYSMRLFFATIIGGSPYPVDGHDDVRWLTRESLQSVEWLGSDEAAVTLIQDQFKTNQ